jgi:hypothetical protein
MANNFNYSLNTTMIVITCEKYASLDIYFNKINGFREKHKMPFIHLNNSNDSNQYIVCEIENNDYDKFKKLNIIHEILTTKITSYYENCDYDLYEKIINGKKNKSKFITRKYNKDNNQMVLSTISSEFFHLLFVKKIFENAQQEFVMSNYHMNNKNNSNNKIVHTYMPNNENNFSDTFDSNNFINPINPINPINHDIHSNNTHLFDLNKTDDTTSSETILSLKKSNNNIHKSLNKLNNMYNDIEEKINEHYEDLDFKIDDNISSLKSELFTTIISELRNIVTLQIKTEISKSKNQLNLDNIPFAIKEYINTCVNERINNSNVTNIENIVTNCVNSKLNNLCNNSQSSYSLF